MKIEVIDNQPQKLDSQEPEANDSTAVEQEATSEAGEQKNVDSFLEGELEVMRERRAAREKQANGEAEDGEDLSSSDSDDKSEEEGEETSEEDDKDLESKESEDEEDKEDKEEVPKKAEQKLSRLHKKIVEKDKQLLFYKRENVEVTQLMNKLTQAVNQQKEYISKIMSDPIHYFNESGNDIFSAMDAMEKNIDKGDASQQKPENNNQVKNEHYEKELKVLKEQQQKMAQLLKSEKQQALLNKEIKSISNVYDTDKYKNLKYFEEKRGLNVYENAMHASMIFNKQTGQNASYSEILDLLEEKVAAQLASEDDERGVIRRQQLEKQNESNNKAAAPKRKESKTLSNKMSSSNVTTRRKETRDERRARLLRAEDRLRG